MHPKNQTIYTSKNFNRYYITTHLFHLSKIKQQLNNTYILSKFLLKHKYQKKTFLLFNLTYFSKTKLKKNPLNYHYYKIQTLKNHPKPQTLFS